MLHGLLFFHVPMSDGFDMGMGMRMGDVSDTHTPFRHPDPQNSMIFEGKKKLALAIKITFLSYIEILYFSLIRFDFKYFLNNFLHII